MVVSNPNSELSFKTLSDLFVYQLFRITLPPRKQYVCITRKKEKYVVSKVIFEDPVGLDWGRKIFSHHVSTLEGLELTKGGSLNK